MGRRSVLPMTKVLIYLADPVAIGPLLPSRWYLPCVSLRALEWEQKGVTIMATAPQPQPPEPERPQLMVIQQTEKNGFGTSSFILGLLGTIFGLVPIGAFIALPASAVGLCLGLFNIGRLRKHVATNKAMTWVGIALSVLGVVFSIIGIVIINNAISNL